MSSDFDKHRAELKLEQKQIREVIMQAGEIRHEIHRRHTC